MTTSADGTTLSLREEPLQPGDSYFVRAYVPHPTRAQMRLAPAGFPPGLREYTRIYLPSRGDSAQAAPPVGDAVGHSRPARQPVEVPLRGEPLTGSPGATRALASSPYARMYRLALRITAGSRTPYAAVRAIDRYLLRHYTYGENTPRHDFPLESFLFKDRFGYCQQFSGAMALMLRMVGIPTRVAAGFTPGSFNRDTKEWRVRDLDAHSWVEVYFNGIGWVRFDPTPPAAPAESQSSGVDAPNLSDAGVFPRPGKVDGGATPKDSPHVRRAHGSGGGLPWWVVALVVGAPLAAIAAALGLVRLAVNRRSKRRASLDAQITEFRSALRRLGLELPPATTLLSLERRLERLAGPPAARYASTLRAARFSASGQVAPSLADRRALRRALTGGRNPLVRLRGLLALPPAPFRGP